MNQESNGKSKILKTGSDNSPRNPHLPEEIVFEILSRLPVKSLLRFRSVSKAWLSLISTSQFINTHLTKSTQNPKFSHHKLILSEGRPDYILKSLSLYDVPNEPITEAVNLDYPTKSPLASVWVVGSVNGLVCLIIDDKWPCFWNPSTRKSTFLPSADVDLDFDNDDSASYGLCYDACTDEYKLLGIFSLFEEFEMVVKVYSSKDRCWRRIKEHPSPHTPLLDDWTFVSGCFHNTRYDAWSSSPHRYAIVSLDLATETYGEVLQPSYVEGDYRLTLSVLEKSLAVCYSYETHADVWIMKEYGLRESWTMLVAIPYLLIDRHCVWPHILENGDILVKLGRDRLMSYNLYKASDNKIKEILNFNGYCKVDSYIESLVSPPGSG